MQISAQMGEEVRKLGGALIDLYVFSTMTVTACDATVRFCAYNHKRPLDPVSPEDFKRACERMSELKDCVLRQRTMSSGAVIMEHVSVYAQARQRQMALAEFAGAKERKGQGVSADEVRETRYVCALRCIRCCFPSSAICRVTLWVLAVQSAR